jgi:hypothetical protein
MHSYPSPHKKEVITKEKTMSIDLLTGLLIGSVLINLAFLFTKPKVNDSDEAWYAVSYKVCADKPRFVEGCQTLAIRVNEHTIPTLFKDIKEHLAKNLLKEQEVPKEYLPLDAQKDIHITNVSYLARK